MKNLLVLVLSLFLVSCSLSKACEPITVNSNISFKSQRCYVIPDFGCIKPLHTEFLPSCNRVCIYVEYFILDNDYALKFSYDNMDQMNWFGVALNEFIYVDTDNDGEFDTEYDITVCIESIVPEWAKTYIGPPKSGSCSK